MQYIHHQMTIEIPLEGILSIEKIHLSQGINRHGRLVLRAVVEEEKALEVVEQCQELWIRVWAQKKEKKRPLFWGKSDTLKVIREDGLLVLEGLFFGGTREWDVGKKSRSFCQLSQPYEELLKQVLSAYPEGELRDEVTGGAPIGQMVLQYEETDWTFLKRLASHFGTVLFPEDNRPYGKVYFGVPTLDQGKVLEEKEYTLLHGQEEADRLKPDLLPQELYRWQVISKEVLSLGEGVRLGHIPVVVTGVDRVTRQGRVVYTYELSRRKGILRAKRYNPQIYGMSLPAAIQERKGNQVRLKLKLDQGYAATEDRAWFTYGIETSNFYCMPQVGSQVHLYFPDQEEGHALAVHALRPEGAEEGGCGQRALPQREVSAPWVSGPEREGGGEPEGRGQAAVSSEAFSSPGAVAASSSSFRPAGGPNQALTGAGRRKEGGEAEPEKEAEEKDPTHKIFSDPSGSFLQLAPQGVTLSTGSGASLGMTSGGLFSLQGTSLTMDSGSTLLMGTGNRGKTPQIYVEAKENLKVSLRGRKSQLLLEERTRFLSPLVEKEASQKPLATPYAYRVRQQLTQEDEDRRAQINQKAEEGLRGAALERKEELLAKKKQEAEAKVREGIWDILTVIGCAAAVVVTGGAAAPLVGAMVVTGGFKTASAVADICEGLSDLDKVEMGDLSQSYNFMRDGVFQGNEGLYQFAKGVNDMLFGLVTGKAVTGNLTKLEKLERLGKLEDLSRWGKKISQGQKYLKEHKALKATLHVTSEVGLGAVEEYVAAGSVDPINVGIDAVTGLVKGFGMEKLTIPCMTQNPLFQNRLVRKAANVVMGTGAGTAVDWGKSKLTREEFDFWGSVQQNLTVSALAEAFGEPIDVVSGAFLLTAVDLRLPDIREGIEMKREYRSTRKKAGWFGPGWQFPYESRLYRAGELIHVTLPCGFVAAFVREEGEEGGYRDTLGNGRFQLSYDGLHQEWQVKDLHQHSLLLYDEAGRLLALEDRNRQRLTLTYWGEYPTQLRTALGYTLHFTFQEGRVTRLKDHTGRTLHYTYEKDRLRAVTHPEGGVSRYEYNEEGFLTQPIDQTGLGYLTNQYDEQGRVLLQTLANGDTYRAVYADQKREVQVEYSAYPGITTYRYEKDQTIREILHPDGTKTLYGYDEKGNRTSVTDRLGRTTYQAYDEVGHKVREERPGGLITTYRYDEAGDMVEVRDNAGRSRQLTYDAYHNLIQTREQAGEGEEIVHRFIYDEQGRLRAQRDGEGYETRYTYAPDSAYPDTTTYGDGTVLRCTYNETGRKVSEEDGAVAFTYGYNPGGYRTLVRDGEGNESHYHYDGMGRLVSHYTPKQVKEGKQKRTRYRYDFLERLVETIHPDDSRQLLLRDGEGNVLKQVHPNAYDPRRGEGEGTRYTYNGDHHLLKIAHPDGGIERLLWDAKGNRIKHILPEQYDAAIDDGPGYSYTYDEEDRLTLVRGPQGEVLSAYTYDLCGNCIRRTDEQGGVWVYTYDLLGRLLQELKPIGEIGREEENPCQYQRTDYRYDRNSNRIQEIRYGGSYDEKGQPLTPGEDLVLTFTYDARNRLLQVQDKGGARVSYGYDARGNRIREEQVIYAGSAQEPPVLRLLCYTYDRAGRVVQKRELMDSGLKGEKKEWARTSYTYDANGNPIHILTPEGYEVHRVFDDRDRLKEEVLTDTPNGIRLATTLTYDQAGKVVQVLQEGRRGKRELTLDYDLKDRLTQISALEGPVFTYGYDGNDNRIEERQLLGAKEEAYLSTHYHYDLSGNLLQTQRKDRIVSQYRYDARGNRTESRDADGVGVSLSYGLGGEVRTISTTRAKQAGKVSQRLSYDARGRIIGLEEAEGRRTGFGLDLWGRIKEVTTAEKGKEGYTYDQAGNLRTTRDALGGVIRYTYTSSSQVASLTDQGGRREYFYYDQEGRQVRHIDRKGILTETRYNVYGKPVFQVCTDKKGRRQVMGSWAYDDFGHLTEARAGGFTYTYEHRPDGKLLKKERNGKTVLICTYYPEGSLKSLTDRRGKTLYYAYDGEGRLESLQTEEKKVLTSYTYTKAGRIESIRHHNGILTHYTYDEEGNIQSLTIKKGENRLLYTASYTYDLRGNRLSKVGQRSGEAEREETLSATYTYDVMNRLIREDRPEGGEEYTYDQRGNRLFQTHYHYALTPKAKGMAPVIDGKESYCYNESNQLIWRETEQESTRYVYDANGSLVKEVTTRAGKKGGKKEEETTLYDYDFLNRQEKVELPGGRSQQAFYDGEGLRAGLTTPEGESYTFLYHQGELIEEEKAGEFLQAYLRGHGLVGIESKDNHYHSCHLDEQGSTLYVTSQWGEAENQYHYDAFGNLLDQKEGFPNRILYTGQQYDQETGQYYLRARYYNPIIGRFLQEDTYRGDGLNLYAYCANNPVMYFDPDGHKKSSNECPGADPVAKQEDTLNPEGMGSESGSTTTPNYLNEYDIIPYGEFKNYPYDDLSGHELLQNAWLEANGKITKRGQGLSKDNPAMALYENPMHKYISSQQKKLGLNKKNLEGTSWRQNVLANIKIMEAAGVPRDKILELAKKTRQFAIDNGF